MKLYVHHEAPPEFTKVLRFDDPSSTVRQLLQAFVTAYNQKHGATSCLLHADQAQVLVLDCQQRVQPLDAKLSKAFEECGDVYVVHAQIHNTQAGGVSAAECAVTTHPPTSGSKPGDRPAEGGTPVTGDVDAAAPPIIDRAPAGPAVPAAAAPAAAQGVEARLPQEHMHILLKPLLKRAREAVANRSYKVANDIFQQVLEGGAKARVINCTCTPLGFCFARQTGWLSRGPLCPLLCAVSKHHD